MSGFLLGAGLLALAALLFVVLPLLRSRAAAPRAAIAALISALVLIGASALIYAKLGNPAALRLANADPNGTARPDIAELARRVQSSPSDEQAWRALAEAYGVSGQYVLAQHAYEEVNTLAGGGDAEALAGIGEAIYLQNGGAQSAQAASYFERALQVDPQSPKALFYSAVIAYQGGQLQLARDRFAALLAITPAPPANVRVDLQRQIARIDAQLHPPVDAATAIRLRVTLAPALARKVPPNASLFVFVQSPGGGPPLAVKRTGVALPEQVELSANDAMLAQHTVHAGQKVTVVARISASGSALSHSGDLYGQIPYVAGQSGSRSLQIDKLTP